MHLPRALRPPGDIFLTGTNPLLLLNELQFLGESRIFARLDGDTPLTISTRSAATSSGTSSSPPTGDRRHTGRLHIRRRREPGRHSYDRQRDSLSGRTPWARGSSSEHIYRHLDLRKHSSRKELRKILVERASSPRKRSKSTLMEREHLKEGQEPHTGGTSGIENIRVPADDSTPWSTSWGFRPPSRPPDLDGVDGGQPNLVSIAEVEHDGRFETHAQHRDAPHRHHLRTLQRLVRDLSRSWAGRWR